MISKRFFAVLIAVLLTVSLSISAFASAQASEEIASDIVLQEGIIGLYAPVEEESAADAAPAVSQANSTAPLFMGAGLSVLMLIGVTLYCKVRGNRTL